MTQPGPHDCFGFGFREALPFLASWFNEETYSAAVYVVQTQVSVRAQPSTTIHNQLLLIMHAWYQAARPRPVSEAFETTRVLSLTHLLGAMHGPAVLHDMHRPVCIEQDAVRNAAGFLLCLIVAPANSHSQQQSASHRVSCHCEASHL